METIGLGMTKSSRWLFQRQYQQTQPGLTPSEPTAMIIGAVSTDINLNINGMSRKKISDCGGTQGAPRECIGTGTATGILFIM